MFCSIKVGNPLRAGHLELMCGLVAAFLSPCSREPLSQLPDRVWIFRGVYAPLPVVWRGERLPQRGGRDPLWWVTAAQGWGTKPASTARAWEQIAFSRACLSCNKAVLASGRSLKRFRMWECFEGCIEIFSLFPAWLKSWNKVPGSGIWAGLAFESVF